MRTALVNKLRLGDFQSCKPSWTTTRGNLSEHQELGHGQFVGRIIAAKDMGNPILWAVNKQVPSYWDV